MIFAAIIIGSVTYSCGVYFLYRMYTSMKLERKISDERVTKRTNELLESHKELETDKMIISQDIEYNNQLILDLKLEQNRLQQLKKHNQTVVSVNEQMIKDANVMIFQLKENAVVIYNHYDCILKMLHGKIYDGNIDTLTQEAFKNRQFIENYFISTFRQHPHDYVKSKTHIHGPGYQSDYSVN